MHVSSACQDQRPECIPDAREAALLRALIARRRHIQREALELAQRIFAAKPQLLAGPIRQAPAETPTSTAS